MVFCLVQKKNFGQHTSQNIYFICRAKCEFFFQNLTLGYMTKTLNQIIFFFLHQNQNIFYQQLWESEYLAEQSVSTNQKARQNSLNFHVYGVCQGCKWDFFQKQT